MTKEEKELAKIASAVGGEETIDVPREQLAQILRDNEEFRAKITQLESDRGTVQPVNPLTRNKKKETLIKMRKWNDQYVIGWENKGKTEKPLYVYSEYNPATRENIQFMNLILKGSKEPLKVEYLNYLREAETVYVKMIKKIEEEPTIIDQGTVYKKDFAQNGYGRFETGIEVPVEVIIPNTSYEVDLPGEKDTLIIKDTFIG